MVRVLYSMRVCLIGHQLPFYPGFKGQPKGLLIEKGLLNKLNHILLYL